MMALWCCAAAARARYRDDLGLGACDMRCLIDKVYQQKDVGLDNHLKNLSALH
jgi:hypothetical protein